VPTRVDDPDESDERNDPDGVDYGWVMQVTFVATIIVGAPVVGLLSAGVTLPSWEARVNFAIRVGAIVWLCTAVSVFFYARRQQTADES
jgi:hydrogenase/urease accessory protein HupE